LTGCEKCSEETEPETDLMALAKGVDGF
jgi:hypothetical protein